MNTIAIDTTIIRQGLPGITPIAAAQLYEAFEVCMHKSGHAEDVSMEIDGISQAIIQIHWEDKFDKQKERTYSDMLYTVEHGAVCLSVLLTNVFLHTYQ